MSINNSPKNDPAGEFKARIEEAFLAELQQSRVLRAQVQAAQERTEDEAAAMARATCDASYGTMKGDANIQGFVVCAVPYSPKASISPGLNENQPTIINFSSSMRGSMSEAMGRVTMRELIPAMVGQWEPKFWGRFEACLRILFLRPAGPYERTDGRKGKLNNY